MSEDSGSRIIIKCFSFLFFWDKFQAVCSQILYMKSVLKVFVCHNCELRSNELKIHYKNHELLSH
jgi:hypothetical protein